MADLSQEDFKALEQTRQRLHQLTNNIASLKQDVVKNAPIPKWPSLQASAMILTNNIQALTMHLSKHSEILNKTVVYPSTNFPGRTQEGLLGQLLRKKLEPSVEGWVEAGKEMGANAQEIEEQENQLRSWAADWIATRVAKYALEEARDDFTVEEREMGVENVRTGLRGDDDDDDDLEVPSKKLFGMGKVSREGAEVMRPNDLLRFSTTGLMADSIRT